MELKCSFYQVVEVEDIEVESLYYYTTFGNVDNLEASTSWQELPSVICANPCVIISQLYMSKLVSHILESFKKSALDFGTYSKKGFIYDQKNTLQIKEI
jgi:hypothetical protein